MRYSAWPDKIREILNVGIKLDAVGVENWALTREQATDALKRFAELEIPILGGDVYEKIDSVIQSNYDNWYSNPRSEEGSSDYTKRSIDEAKKYIESYPEVEGRDMFFVFTPQSE